MRFHDPEVDRPTPRFQVGKRVWTPADWKAVVIEVAWQDGTWLYGVRRVTQPRALLLRFAEHDLEAAR